MKRPGWVILILILLGGWLLNVASGWVCEWMAHARWLASPIYYPASWSPSAAEVAWWRRHAPPGWPQRPDRAMRVSRIGTQSILMIRDRSSNVFVAHLVQRDRSGWPMISMEGVRWADSQSSTTTTHFDGKLGGTNSWLTLNLRPLWPGTIINTIFYALILLGVYYGPRAMRRRRRIRRGKCPGCAYDLRGGGHATCPECGAAVTG